MSTINYYLATAMLLPLLRPCLELSSRPAEERAGQNKLDAVATGEHEMGRKRSMSPVTVPRRQVPELLHDSTWCHAQAVDHLLRTVPTILTLTIALPQNRYRYRGTHPAERELEVPQTSWMDEDEATPTPGNRRKKQGTRFSRASNSSCQALSLSDLASLASLSCAPSPAACVCCWWLEPLAT
jgi:hypothetical protein